MTAPTLPKLPEGITPLDLLDEMHRNKLAEADFDPIEEARDQIRAACSKLIEAIAYLHGSPRQAIVDNMLKVGDRTLSGDAYLLDMLDTLTIWTTEGTQEVIGKQVQP